MYLCRSESGWEALAPAKLNLFLDVIGRRSDGFHELETLMVPVRLFDSLSLKVLSPTGNLAGPIELDIRRPLQAADQHTNVPGDHSNLVVRALKLLQQQSGCLQGARIELLKRIPVGAGLGGGSSDAAAALALANRAWGLRWSREQLASLAAQLGSDIPFFLSPGAAICRGRGEQVARVAGVPPLHVVMAKPAESLATAAVFQTLDDIEPLAERPSRLRELVDRWRGGDWNCLKKLMTNRLEVAALHVLPQLANVREKFAQLDFVGHQLTGSGSGYFGVCRSADHAARMAALLRARLPMWVCATCMSR